MAPMHMGGIETNYHSPPNSSLVPEGACNQKILIEPLDESSSSLDSLHTVPILITTKPPPGNHHIQHVQLIGYTKRMLPTFLTSP